MHSSCTQKRLSPFLLGSRSQACPLDESQRQRKRPIEGLKRQAGSNAEHEKDAMQPAPECRPMLRRSHLVKES